MYIWLILNILCFQFKTRVYHTDSWLFPFTLASIHRGVLQEEFGSLRKPQHGLRVHPDQARGGAAEVRDHIAHTV